MTQETKEFVDKYLKKLDLYDQENLNSIFDQFQTAYTIFNRLYNESFNIVKSKKVLKKTRYSDFEKATSCQIDFLQASKILECLSNSSNLVDVKNISIIIKNDIFNINIDNGVPQKERDQILLDNLVSENKKIKARAILSYIYNVRSNLVHGEKHFEENQRMILLPLISILKSIINLQIETLYNYNHKL